MKLTPTIAVMALLAALSLHATPALTAYTQVSDVISGGGQLVSSGSYSNNGTIGQSSAIGLSSGGSYTNHGGFWNLRTGDTIPPTTPLFTLLSPAHSLTVPITTLSSTDVGSGVTGYYFSSSTTPPTDAWSAGWVTPTPANLLAASKGLGQTFYVWSRDGAGNISGGASATTDIIFQWILSVSLAGTGGTSITSSPGLIACGSGTNVCSDTFDENTVITLTGSPGAKSQLTTWSGTTSGTANLLTLPPITANISETATFGDVNTPARIVYDKGYTTLPAALTALRASGMIEARDNYVSGVAENLLFNQGYTVNLLGGLNATWDPTASFTTVNGKLTVSSGKVSVQGIKLHP